MKKGFDSELMHNEKHLKIEIKFYDGKINKMSNKIMVFLKKVVILIVDQWYQ